MDLLAREVDIPISWHSCGQLATMLVGTFFPVFHVSSTFLIEGVLKSKGLPSERSNMEKSDLCPQANFQDSKMSTVLSIS